MTDNKHNGWTNYPTWRVNLEIFDDLEINELCTAEWCRDYTRELLELDYESKPFGSSSNQSLALDYAMAFIDTVNWYEISEHLNERFKK